MILAPANRRSENIGVLTVVVTELKLRFASHGPLSTHPWASAVETSGPFLRWCYELLRSDCANLLGNNPVKDGQIDVVETSRKLWR